MSIKRAIMDGFIWPVRVYYEDTDAGGVVYHAAYLRFMERARTEWLRELGFEQDTLREQGFLFAVKRIQVDFHRPARFNQLLRVHSAIGQLGRASMTFLQDIVSDGQCLCRGEVQVVCLDASGFRPVALPGALASTLKEELSRVG